MTFDRILAVREMVARLLLGRGYDGEVGDDESLFVSGRLDSVTAIDLIMQLETDFGLDFSRMDFDVAAIDSIGAISRLVDERKAA